MNPIADVTEAEVAKVWEVNVDGVLWGIQAAAAKFHQRGQSCKISCTRFDVQIVHSDN